jgi:hypothetical protein
VKSPFYKNVDFLNLHTGPVQSNLSRLSEFISPKAYDYAKSALCQLGYTTDDTGHWKNHLLLVGIRNPIFLIPLILHVAKNEDKMGHENPQKPVQD